MKIMRINYRIWLVWGALTASASTVLTSCTESFLKENLLTEDTPIQEPVREPAPLLIGSTGLETVVSRADQTLNKGGEQIGVFVKEDAEYKLVSNRLFTYDKAKSLWESDDAVLLRTPVATLGAYYPWKSTRTQPIPMVCQEYTGIEDVSAVAFTANNLNNKINLKMKRIYSRLVVTFVKATGVKEYHGDAKVTSFSLKGTGVNAEAFYDLFTGIQLKAPDQPIEFEKIDYQADHATKKTMDCLIVPSTLDGTLTFEATVDEKAMKGTVDAATLCGAGKQLKAGVQYKLTVTVNPTALEVSSLQVVDWEVVTIKGPTDGSFKPEK